MIFGANNTTNGQRFVVAEFHLAKRIGCNTEAGQNNKIYPFGANSCWAKHMDALELTARLPENGTAIGNRAKW